MAKLKNSSTPSNVYAQIQEIIAKHIGSLESDKMAQAEKATQMIKESESNLERTNGMIVVADKDLKNLEDKKTKLNTDIEKLKTSKVLKDKELSEITNEVTTQKENLDKINKEKTTSSNVVDDLIEKIKVLGERKSKAVEECNSLNNLLRDKQIESDNLDKKIAENKLSLKSLQDDQNNLVTSNKLLAQKNKQLVLDGEKAASETLVLATNKETSQTEYNEFVLDIESKKVQANKELKYVLDEVEANKAVITEENSKIESEKLFLKQMADLNAQKNNGFVYTKTELKKIITKLILEVDGNKGSELKNLLSIVEKL